QAGSTPAASVTADGVHLLGTDGPGSVLLSRHNDRTSRFRYTPYGQQAAADSDPDLPGYNGERQDPAGGGDHLGNGYRTYNPVLMRFTAPDSLSPFGAGGLNPYAYCLGDPINRTDPSGHISVGSILGIALGLFGMAAELAAVIPTGGASLTLSGAVLAGAGFLGAATGLASSLTEESNPQASSILGWVSMGAGVVSMVPLFGKLARGMKAMVTQVGRSFNRSPAGPVMEIIGPTIEESPRGLNMAAPLPRPSNALDAFDRTVSAGWIQEVQTHVQTPFITHSLELSLPQQGVPRIIGNTENPFLQLLSFDTSLPVSRMNNAVPNSVIHVDITIPVARTLYAPFINDRTGRAGVGFINYIRHDIGVRQILAAENRIRGTQHMVEYQQSVISLMEENWNNVRLSGNPRGLMQAIIQHQIPQIWRQFCTSGLDVFAFYNQHIFI
ncbi:RHS repeat-associated core domain-containing protein, partial [Xenorhabdus stockiae]|uniref:RHS repeat-associated core domain-containing protein n=1 Tax=Xenorhabdus stockiae TaxID=351614 RepID=UPI00245283FB